MVRVSLESANADPFAIVTAPPSNETVQERILRETQEAEAKRISDEIDQKLKTERAAQKKNKKAVKVLLLGQAESGKSTTLKNFQLKYASEAWKQERTSWRAVIQLNIIRSIKTIIEALSLEMSGNQFRDSDDEDAAVPTPASPLPFTDNHQLLKLRLLPLRRIEADLKRRLGAASEEIAFSSMSMVASSLDGEPSAQPAKKGAVQEFCVRSWKNAFETHLGPTKGSVSSHGALDSDEATDVIAECREDMKALWEDPVVQRVLRRRKIRLQDSAGFFLNDIDRIALRDYEPTDDDIVRARLRTLGVQEHRLIIDEGPEYGREWVIYDVGGSRSVRQAWVPYFDDVNAIIFLAPISCFDEHLAEDPHVNRLEDTFFLWKTIASSPLLANAAIIIFMNKCDILEEKINNGIVVKKYMPSYGDRTNTASQVTKYLRGKFKELLKQHSPEPRTFYGYTTSVIDTKATAATLSSVRDSIVRDHLKQADLV